MLPGGRLTITKLPLHTLISIAYGLSVQSSRLSGGHEWIRTERYDIEAAAEKGALSPELTSKQGEAKLMLMLRTLLAQRFHLSVRIETKDLPVYAITVAKGGPKFAKAEVQEKDCTEDSEPAHTPCHVFNGGQGRGLHGKAVDMDDLAGFVQNWTDRPVIDKTALQGLFAIESEGWAPIVPRQEPGAGGEEGFSNPTRPTLFMIFDRLGLKLESRRALVNLYIIERVEKPTEN